MKPPLAVDFVVECVGSLAVITPASKRARRWYIEHVDGVDGWIGVPPADVDDVLDVIRESKLIIANTRFGLH